jgi:hypothetical protein
MRAHRLKITDEDGLRYHYTATQEEAKKMSKRFKDTDDEVTVYIELVEVPTNKHGLITYLNLVAGTYTNDLLINK